MYSVSFLLLPDSDQDQLLLAGTHLLLTPSLSDIPVCSVLSLPKLGTRHWLLNVLLPTCSSIPRMSQYWRK